MCPKPPPTVILRVPGCVDVCFPGGQEFSVLCCVPSFLCRHIVQLCREELSGDARYRTAVGFACGAPGNSVPWV